MGFTWACHLGPTWPQTGKWRAWAFVGLALKNPMPYHAFLIAQPILLCVALLYNISLFNHNFIRISYLFLFTFIYFYLLLFIFTIFLFIFNLIWFALILFYLLYFISYFILFLFHI